MIRVSVNFPPWLCCDCGATHARREWATYYEALFVVEVMRGAVEFLGGNSG